MLDSRTRRQDLSERRARARRRHARRRAGRDRRGGRRLRLRQVDLAARDLGPRHAEPGRASCSTACAITAPHEKIGIIFQEPRLLPWLDRRRQRRLRPRGPAARPSATQRVASALDRVGLTDKADVWPRELSGGQAQRVAIARALVPRPRGAAARRAVLGARRLHPRRSAGSSARPVGRSSSRR